MDSPLKLRGAGRDGETISTVNILNIVLEVLASAIRQEKEIKDKQI